MCRPWSRPRYTSPRQTRPPTGSCWSAWWPRNRKCTWTCSTWLPMGQLPLRQGHSVEAQQRDHVIAATWSLNWFHVITELIPHDHWIDSTWSLNWLHLITELIPHDHWIDSTWALNWFHVNTELIKPDHWTDTTWSLNWFHVITELIPREHWID